MTTRALAARLVDGPHVSAPDKAEEILQGWLADLEPAQSAEIGELLAPSASDKPRDHPARHCRVLALPVRSVRADAARLIRLLRCEPETHLVAPDRGDVARGACRRERSRGDAAAPAHEVRGGAADCAVRYRRRLAGDAGDGGADRSRGGLGADGAALSAAPGSRARHGCRLPIPKGPRTTAACSCSPWARWARASSTIPATSI